MLWWYSIMDCIIWREAGYYGCFIPATGREGVNFLFPEAQGKGHFEDPNFEKHCHHRIPITLLKKENPNAFCDVPGNSLISWLAFCVSYPITYPTITFILPECHLRHTFKSFANISSLCSVGIRSSQVDWKRQPKGNVSKCKGVEIYAAVSTAKD